MANINYSLCIGHMDNFEVIINFKNAAFYHNLHFYDYALKLLFEIHAELVEIMKDAVTALLMQLTQSLKRAHICKGCSS